MVGATGGEPSFGVAIGRSAAGASRTDRTRLSILPVAARRSDNQKLSWESSSGLFEHLQASKARLFYQRLEEFDAGSEPVQLFARNPIFARVSGLDVGFP